MLSIAIVVRQLAPLQDALQREAPQELAIRKTEGLARMAQVVGNGLLLQDSS